jgi:DNA-binding response OmpR family regulator
VMVVEDEEDVRVLYATSLRDAGFEVIEAASARDAIEAVGVRPPSVVVLDRGLGDRDGLDLARQWKAARAMASVPIILLSGSTTRIDVERALTAGCDVFLAKPCPPDVLVAHVHKLLLAMAPTKKTPKFRP